MLCVMSATTRDIPATYRLTSGSPIRLESAGQQAEARTRPWVGLAYTGADVNIGWYGRCVFDLSGIDLGDQRKPCYRQHDPRLIAGHTSELEVTERGLEVKAGTITRSTASGREVWDLADDDFPWQLSVGLDIPSERYIEELSPGDTAEVNGREVYGPILIFRKSKLGEISFVPQGADGDTSALALENGGRINLKKAEAPMPQDDKPVGGVEADTKERDRVLALLKAFPDDVKFAQDQIERGVSLAEAKQLYSYVEAEKKKAADQVAELEDLRSKVAALESAPKGTRPVSGAIGDPGTESGDATVQWKQAVRAQMERGKSQAQAQTEVMRTNPQLHMDYLREVNPGMTLNYDRGHNRVAF